MTEMLGDKQYVAPRLPSFVDPQPRVVEHPRAVIDGSMADADVACVAPRRGRWFAVAAVFPLVDALALTGALGVVGHIGVASAIYAAAVVVLARRRRVPISLRVSDQVSRILVATVVPLVCLLPWLTATVAWRLALCSVVFVWVARALAYAGLRLLRRQRRLAEPALIVGAGETGVYIAKSLVAHPELGLEPLGFLDSFTPSDDAPPLRILGGVSELPEMIGSLGIRRVIVGFPVDRDRDMVAVLRRCRSMPVDICLVPRLQELGSGVPRGSLDEIWGIPLLPLSRPGRGAVVAKRIIDVFGAAILLCLCLPFLLVLGVALRLQSRRPALFRQTRVTKAGRTTSIVKLRTLQDHGDSDTTWTVPTEGCTRLGRWLRTSHIDELPQLVNVLRGDMSLVGPRPERPYFADRFAREIPHYRDRNRMAAGMTGWAQVNGLSGDTAMRDRVRFDNRYIESWSLWLDAVILARTVGTALVTSLGGKRSAAMGASAPIDPNPVGAARPH